MSVVEFRMQTRHEFFNTWIQEVDTKAGALGEKYLVFSAGDSLTSYAYFPNGLLKHNLGLVDGCVLQMFPDGVDPDTTPIHCVPATDMSLSTLEYFCQTTQGQPLELLRWPSQVETGSSLANQCEQGYALEDVKLEDVVLRCTHTFSLVESAPSVPDHIQVTSVSSAAQELHNHNDSEIREMYKFVALASSDPSRLLSYIKHAIVSRGYDDIMTHCSDFSDIVPVRYTMLEARSEMKRSNSSLYDLYKNNIATSMLKSVINESRSKQEMEYKITGLAYEMLIDVVVNCMNVLWHFKDGLWQECSSDAYIWNFLTYDFISYLSNKNVDDVAQEVMKNYVRSRMRKDIKMRLQDDKFYEKLDSKRHIILMENGIYDTGKETLSKPVPSDYASVTAGVPYHIFDLNSHKVCQLMRILKTIFSNQDVLDFFILSCSTFLEGYNSPKLFFIWWGQGNNAKTLVQTLVMKTFGEYCSTAPTSVVTGKSTQSSNATPDLCHVEKKLVVFLQEPNPEEKIQAGKMKEMTGNDSMYVRQLFKSGHTMVLKAKIVIVCNNILEIPGMDAAMRRRIMVVPFNSTFLDPSEFRNKSKKGTLEPNSNIIDVSIENDLLSCKAAFMYMLCRRYSEWVNQDNRLMKVPDVIKEVTNDYVTRNNYEQRFIKQYMQKIMGSTVTAAETYESFKEWFRKSYPGKKVHNFEKFTKEVAEEGYKEDSRGNIHDVFVNYKGE